MMCFMCSLALAKADDANLVAIGQGISSPSSTSTINYSSGYTSENPVGVLYQNNFRLSVQYDQNDDSDAPKGLGAEFGYGTGEWGAAIGHYKRDCTGCEGNTAGALAINLSGVGFGVKIREDIYGLGLLFNTHGNNRVGLMFEVNDTGGDGNKINSYALGYSYVATNFTITVDASKQDYENSTAGNNDLVLLTPGVGLRITDTVQVSVNDRIVLDDGKNVDEDLWFGVGLGGGGNWHFAGYSDYVNDLALVLSVYF